jgi:cbb3-type cytochrome oxidase subunit 3
MNIIEQIEIILLIATMGLSILLSALSVSAYRNSRLKKMIYATIAYSLFAIVSLSQFYEEFLLEGGNEAHPNFIINIAVHSIPLAILILFFIGIVKKEKYSNALQQSSASP